MRFPPDFIDRLKHHSPISQVIGKRLAVKKHGREFMALCPFHNEKSPSFTISDEKGFYHCFGCGAHGDAIGFIKEYERLTYPEAVEKLAGEAGIALPVMTREVAQSYQRQGQLKEVCEEAALWFQKQLMLAEGERTRNYLKERGISPEMIAQFRIGFAPPSRDGLKQYLLKKGYKEEALAAAGLVAKPDDGPTYDRFRERLMFPITDLGGRVIAFGGRVLPYVTNPNAAKYLNSAETELFKKGELLYAWQLARRAIGEKQTAIVTEGYLDVIALHQAGFTHAVAPLGTAITANHLKLLWHVTPEPILCLDGDTAGQKAMQRAAELALPLIKSGYGLKFATLPPGEDPDSLIAKQGTSAMQAILDKALSFSETLWQTQRIAIGSESPEQRARLEAKLMGLAESMTDAALKNHFRDYFRQQLFALTRAQQTQQKGKFGKKMPHAGGALTSNIAAMAKGNAASSGVFALQEQFLSLILNHPQLLQQADIEEQFCHLEVADAQLDNIRGATLELVHHSEQATREQVFKMLADKGYSETVNGILKRTSISVPRSFAKSESAELLFRQIVHAIAENKIKEERAEVVVRLGQDMDEARFRQLAELQAHAERNPEGAHFLLPED